MVSEELRDFCEFHAISINKFLQNIFVREKYEQKYNNRNRKWKIRHSEIKDFPLIVPISIHFAHRYPELVSMGKIIIVCDEIHKYQAYINPKIIIQLSHREKLEEELREIKKRVYGLQDLEQGYQALTVIRQQLESIAEDERIIKHFVGEGSIDYSQNMGEQITQRKLVKNYT